MSKSKSPNTNKPSTSGTPSKPNIPATPDKQRQQGSKVSDEKFGRTVTNIKPSPPKQED